MKKFYSLVFAILMALGISSVASAEPTMSFDIDFYGGDTYLEKGVLDTGGTINLCPCQTVWVDLYVSGFDEPGNGLAGYGFQLPFDPVNLEVVGPTSGSPPVLAPHLVPIFHWVDMGSSEILPDNLKVGAVYFKMDADGSWLGAEGDNILLATFAFHCVGPGVDDLIIYDLNPGDYVDWITLGGDVLDYQVVNEGDGVYLATVNNVPIPGAVWLLGSGLLGLVGSGLRRKKRS